MTSKRPRSVLRTDHGSTGTSHGRMGEPHGSAALVPQDGNGWHQIRSSIESSGRRSARSSGRSLKGRNPSRWATGNLRRCSIASPRNCVRRTRQRA